jgi:hypothetical protein
MALGQTVVIITRVLGLIVLLTVIGCVFSPDFRAVQNFQNVLEQSAPLPRDPSLEGAGDDRLLPQKSCPPGRHDGLLMDVVAEQFSADPAVAHHQRPVRHADDLGQL